MSTNDLEPEVLVVSTGAANVASVMAAFVRLGARPRLAENARELLAARRVVLPGVGAFAPAASRLQEFGYDAALRERVDAGLPTLAICLGLQLLCEASEESPGTAGLGLVPGQLERFGGDLCVPQIGWNRVEPQGNALAEPQGNALAGQPGQVLVEPGAAYFANSYRLVSAPLGWSVALSDYGGPFVSAIERGAVLACQFHPELSGAWGARLLERWLERGREVQ